MKRNIMAIARKRQDGARQYYEAMLEAERNGETVDWPAVIAIIDDVERHMYAAQDSAAAADYPACADGRW